MRMAKGLGHWVEARQIASYMLNDVREGEIRPGDKIWRSAFVARTDNYSYITIATDGNLMVQARGLTSGEQWVGGDRSEWRVVER